MKNNKISNIFLLLLLSSFISMPVLAESPSSSDEIVSQNYYGKINKVYKEELRMVISDMNLKYNNNTGFYKASGARISSIRRELNSGVFVKFNIYQQGADNILKDLQIISKRDFDVSEKSGIKLE